jgi:hypothetical protein
MRASRWRAWSTCPRRRYPRLGQRPVRAPRWPARAQRVFRHLLVTRCCRAYTGTCGAWACSRPPVRWYAYGRAGRGRLGNHTRSTVSPGRTSIAMSPPCRPTTMRREMSRPEPGALTHALGREERARKHGPWPLGRPRPRVADLHENSVALRTGRQPERAGPGHGVDSVGHEVGPHLVELAGIASMLGVAGSYSRTTLTPSGMRCASITRVASSPSITTVC